MLDYTYLLYNRDRAEVAEWQTRYVQGVVSVRAWGFKSPLRHQHYLLAMKQKYATQEELVNLIGSEPWERKFYKYPPLGSLSCSRGYLYAAGSADVNTGPGSIVAGVDLFRRDPKDYPCDINVDHYDLRPTGGTLRVEGPSRPAYHHLPNLPEELRPPFSF